MQKSCPSCGAEIYPGARFCRRCGATLQVAGDGTGDVSPQAATVPLDAEAARTTDGLDAGEESASADTSRVSRAEMERLLRVAQDADRQKLRDPNVTSANLASDALARSLPGGDKHFRDSEEIEETLVRPPAVTGNVATASRDTEEELTLTVPRPTRALDAYAQSDSAATIPQLITRETTNFDHADSQTASQESASRESSQQELAEHTRDELSPAQQQVQEARGAQAVAARQRRRWPYVVAAACVVALAVTVAAAFLAVKFFRKPTLAALPSPSPTAPSTADASAFDGKLSEAESLLAQGNMDEAVARLREANALDPSNTRAHRRLGELLLASGARRDAIEEFRAVTRNAPEDFTAWRELATAQFAEGLYRDAADSYRRLVSLVGDQSAEADDLLSYADALRLSGRADEARSIYQRLAASSSEDVAATARQRLAELAQAQTASPPQHTSDPEGPMVGQHEPDSSLLTQPMAPPQPVPTPTPRPTPTPTPARAPASTPAEHYQRGVELWSSNRTAALQEFQAAAGGGSVDANYYLGLSYVEGKDIHNLNRAALLAALRYFQLAQRGGGQHAAESRRYEQELGKEFDRMRKQ
ncbi:MAG TPA: tetratricopeptide repeat protein [Pyrinomonadaceae bacterium]|nr:tetratricopeptide repeat protein [Pyrinomonadaceae bacterium]